MFIFLKITNINYLIYWMLINTIRILLISGSKAMDYTLVCIKITKQSIKFFQPHFHKLRINDFQSLSLNIEVIEK